MGEPETRPRLVSERRLESWKEIASYLGKDARTARRWEQTEGLPVHRHQHAKLGSVYAFPREIDAWLAARSARPDPPAPVSPGAAQKDTPRRRFLLPAVLMGVAALSGWLLFPRKAPDIAQLPRPLTSYLGDETIPALAPDGKHVAYAWDGEKGDNYDVYIQATEHGKPLRLTTDPRLDISPAFSPDGRSIAFLRSDLSTGSDLLVVAAAGGPERRLARLNLRPRRPEALLDWSADGKWVIAADSDPAASVTALFAIGAETGEMHRLTSPGRDESDLSPALSSDGRSLLFTRGFGNGTSAVMILDLDGQTRPERLPRRLAFHGFENVIMNRPQWLRDGKSFLFSATRGGTSRLWRGSASDPRTAQLLGAAGEQAHFPSVSRTGDRLAFARQLARASVWRLRLQDANPAPERLIASTRFDENPQFSPDGQKITFESSRSGAGEIWTTGSDGSNPVQLTKIGGPITGSPRWSPDGSSIAFDSRYEEGAQVYVIPAAGGPPVRLTHPPSHSIVPSWSRDGHWIYFASRRTGRYEVWRMRARGGEETQVTANGGFSASESPDGRYLYYTKEPSSPTPLARIALSGGAEEIIAPAIVDRGFAVGEQFIYYIPIPGSDGRTSLQALDIRTRKVTGVCSLEGGIGTGLSLSPDGRTVLFARKDAESHDLMLVEQIR